MRTMVIRCVVALTAALCGLSTAVETPEGAAYLLNNAAKEGVVVLPSGLQYKVSGVDINKMLKPGMDSFLHSLVPSHIPRTAMQQC